MIIVYCPFCGKELRYSVEIAETEIQVSEYPADRGECRCEYHDNDYILQTNLQEFAKERCMSQLRVIVENSEFR